jgi:predicted dehydrogenase
LSTNPIRVGIVGCGAVTERYHLPALAATTDVSVVAFADPAIERAHALAARVGAPLAVAHHDAFAGHVDLALVATPNASHESIAVDLLRAGVHVLVEKPMARTTAECDRMLAAAASAGMVLAVGHDFRHFPIARFAREYLGAEMLGAIRRVDVRQSAGGRWPYASPAALSPAAGGGVLLDFGVHLFDLLLWWLGDLRPIRYRDDAAGGIEGECVAELALENGAPVHFELSRSRTLRDTVLIEGHRGTLELGVFEPAVVRLTAVGGAATLAGTVPDAAFERAPLRTVFGRQLTEVVAAIRNGHEPPVSGREGRRAVALVEACYARREPLRQPWDYPEAYATVAERAAGHGV